MRDIKAWLESLGLSHLVPTFEAERIDLDVLPDLGDEQLKELGITAMGDRMRLRRGIADLRPAAATIGAERRQVTVLSLGAGDTPAARATIEAAGGHLVEAQDGSLNVMFGFPTAQEDAADRAVRLGLALREASPQGRIGAATGMMTIEAGSAEPVGDVTARAQALQELARPGSLLIAETTRIMAGAGFVYRGVDRRRLSEARETSAVWQVLGRETVATRYKAERGVKMMPLVGRQRELDFLVDRWRQAKGGEGQVVLVAGEAGIGKSRLVEALAERLSADQPVIFRYQGVAALSNTALHAMTAQVERVSRFQFGDDDATKLEKLRAAMVPEALDDEDFDALATMLAIPLPTPQPAMSADERKRRMFKAITSQLLAVAQRSPTLIVIEDAHWLDPTSNELNDLVASLIVDQPVMMLVTHRPGFTASWGEHGNVTAIQLGTLNASEAAQMLGALAGGRLPPASMRRILARAEGNPLYLEELARAVLENQAPAIAGADPDVPATLQDSLQTRIDLLGRAKPVAQAAAAIGREWSVDLLRNVLDLEAAALEAHLQALREAGLAHPVADAAVPTYAFKHALIRDAAYATLPPDQRRRLHAAIAGIVRDKFPLLAAQRPELLAQHFTAADSWPQAVAAWRQAAATAAASSSHAEAMSNARRGLELLHRLDSQQAREVGELELRLVLGLGYQALKGYADPSVETELGRAWTLADNVGSDEQRSDILSGLMHFYFLRGDARRAREQAEACIALTRRAGMTARLASAKAELGDVLFWLGDFQGARAELDGCLEIVKRLQSVGDMRAQLDPRVVGHAYRGLVLWYLGYPAQARDDAQEAVRQARLARQPLALATALMWAYYVHYIRGDTATATALMVELRKLSDSHGFTFWRSRCRGAEAQLCLDRGEIGDAAALLDESTALMRDTGTVRERSWQLSVAARLAVAQGRTADAMSLLDDALAASKATKEEHLMAEVHRFRARLLPDDKAIPELQTAIAVAQRQQAKSLELRAAIDLARRHQHAGDGAAARAVLQPVVDWFTEDDGDRALASARKLLARLQ